MKGMISYQKVIVTGSSGFIGSNLKKYIEVDWQVEPLSVRFTPNQKFALECDAFIHLAGKAHDLKKVSVPRDYYEANFELTKQLYDAFIQSDAKVFIFMSTVKAVADKVDEVLIEDTIPAPKTHYGIAKHQAEKYILGKDLPEGKRVYILRPCMIHGPTNKGNLNLLYKLVAKGLPWPLGAFENQRSFLSIENLCFVIKELIDNTSIPSGVYQVADDQPISTNQLILLLGESLGMKSKILSLPKNMIDSVAKLGDFLNLPLNTERLQKLTENYMVSNEKLLKAMGKCLPVSAEAGLMKTFKSFRK